MHTHEQTLPDSSDYARTCVQVRHPHWLALGVMYVATICCIIAQRNTQGDIQCDTQHNYANLTFPVITQVKKYGIMT